jgi:SAM-dependent methyltransferase
VSNEMLWEQHAQWWQREFASGSEPEYEQQLLPLVARHLVGARRVLDVGCGEGQVARRIAGPGVEVVGLDPTISQIRAAHARGSGPQYARARAEALPCRTASFDAVVVCLALEHVHAFEIAIHEVARVLERGGRFLLLLSHPLLQAPRSGWVDDQSLGEHYWRIGAYLNDHAEVDEVAPGVRLRFVHRPLSRYVHAMGQAGLLVEDMEEPPPPPELAEDEWKFPEASTIPRVLVVLARHIP